MPKISVIIPMHNVENYIKECLDSILKQTFQDFEVLVINDQSTDQSRNIVQSYIDDGCKKIKIFDVSFGGPSRSRNFGIAHARGEYLYFIDSDDFVKKNLFAYVLSEMEKKDAEIAVFDSYEYDNDEKKTILKGKKQAGTNNELDNWIISPPAVWNKMFKKELFNRTGILFPEDLLYEDLATLPRLFLQAKKVIYLEKALHYYRQREGSIMNSINRKLFHMYPSLQVLLEFYRDHQAFEAHEEALSLVTALNVFFVIRTLAISSFIDKYQKQKEGIKFLISYFPKWYKNDLYRHLPLKTRIHMCIMKYPSLLKCYNLIRKGGY